MIGRSIGLMTSHPKHASSILRIILLGFPTILAPCGSFAEPSDPGQIARRAFFAIEAKPFDPDTVRNAERDTASALTRAPADPWPLIAAARLILERGYLRGERTQLSSYDADSVKAAR